MKDLFGRELTSMRISLTTNCNLHCFYCHQEGQSDHTQVMTLEHYKKLFNISHKIGITKVKFTGGEPLLRTDILNIIKLARQYFSDISITTNGTLLKNLAKPLKEAGLNRINISLHTLKPEVYRKITGADAHTQVIEGIYAAKQAELDPIKINYVVMKNLNDSEFIDMIKFTAKLQTILQVIELEVPVEEELRDWYRKYHMRLTAFEEYLEQRKLRVMYNHLHHRKKYFLNIEGNVAEVELVMPMHNTEFCKYCKRIRFTASGAVKPCLFRNDNLTELFPYLNDGLSEDKLLSIFKSAILKREPYWKDKLYSNC